MWTSNLNWDNLPHQSENQQYLHLYTWWLHHLLSCSTQTTSFCNWHIWDSNHTGHKKHYTSAQMSHSESELISAKSSSPLQTPPSQSPIKIRLSATSALSFTPSQKATYKLQYNKTCLNSYITNKMNFRLFSEFYIGASWKYC